MSHAYCGEMWLLARNDAERILTLEREGHRHSAKTKKDSLRYALTMYIRYRYVVKKLINCHDQTDQCQMRRLIKLMLDCAIARMLEYRRDIVKLDASEYHWPDDIIIEMKLTPDDLRLDPPKFCEENVYKRREFIDEMIVELSKPDPEPEVETQVEEVEEEKTKPRRGLKAKVQEKKILLPLETDEQKAERERREAAELAFKSAILIIQSHERARVARIISKNIELDKKYKIAVAEGKLLPKKYTCEELNRAATLIQKVWRGKRVRQEIRERYRKMEKILEMTMVERRHAEKLFNSDHEHFVMKFEKIERNQKLTEEITENIRTKLFRLRGPSLLEDISDEIREWFVMWYNEVGLFGPFPAAELGGSVAIATEEAPTPATFFEGEKKQKEKKKTNKNKEIKTDKEPMSLTYQDLVLACRNFTRDWLIRIGRNSENSNVPKLRAYKGVYLDLVKDEVCYELQMQVRAAADELMRMEWNALQQALTKDKQTDDPEWENPTWKREKRKRKKREEKKKIIDDTPIEELLKQLVRAGIVRKYSSARLKEWQGDLSYQNYEARLESRDHRHCIGEVSQVVMDYCILPLLSIRVHQLAPLVRSVCICGLSGTGKNFLADAIMSETGALKIDLTPGEWMANYDETNKKQLFASIERVSKYYAPCVIFVGRAEQVWSKKTSEENFDCTSFAKNYANLVKNIKRGDRVLFLTTTNAPFNAKRTFKKIHDKFVIIPKTDYGSAMLCYKYSLLKYPTLYPDLDVSSLALMSRGYPLGMIVRAIDDTLNLKRRITLRHKPLSEKEIYNTLNSYTLDSKIITKFEKFVNGLPLEKRRRRILKSERSDRKKGKKNKTK